MTNTTTIMARYRCGFCELTSQPHPAFRKQASGICRLHFRLDGIEIDSRVAVMIRDRCFMVAVIAALIMPAMVLPAADTETAGNPPAWLTQPLSLTDCIDLALKQNSNVKKSVNDLETAYGVSLQTRAIVVPKAGISGSYQANEPSLIETIPGIPAVFP